MRELYPDLEAPIGIDVLGDEFPNPFQPWRPTPPSPLAADIPGADTSNWTDRPRPAVTAWQGADLDAYYLEDAAAWRWIHCRTGEVWHA